MYKLSKRSYERLNGIESILIAILTESIKNSPFDFGIPRSGGLRTAEEQNELFKKKRSKCNGYTTKSKHQSGLAFDIYIYDAKTKTANWDKSKLTEVAQHILKIADDEFKTQLNWGGNWKSWKDYPHFQLD
jgi:peptidoglycan L-alanyl-D-glutamate endopeptidase CwlK